MINIGYLLGFFAALAQFKLIIGVPAFLVALFMLLPKALPRTDLSRIALYLSVAIVWMLAIQTLFGNRDLLAVLGALLGPTMLLMSTFLKISESIIINLFKALFALFLVDLFFNVSTLLFGMDPLGRGAGVRPGDYLPRLGGVVGHPFASVNFTVIACFAGLVLKNRKMFFLASFGLLINGTFKAPMALALIMSILIVLHILPRTWMFMSLFLSVTATVVYAVILTAGDGDFLTGNALRVIAWMNAIEKIGESPIIGYHGFRTGNFEVMSADTLLDFGIAESPLLQLWLDYGFFAPFLIMITFITIISTSLKKYRSNPHNPIYLAGAAMAAYTFIDLAYGTFFGSINTTIPMALLCLSYRESFSERFR